MRIGVKKVFEKIEAAPTGPYLVDISIFDSDMKIELGPVSEWFDHADHESDDILCRSVLVLP